MYPKMYPKFQEAAFRVDLGGWGSDAGKVGVFFSSLRQQNERLFYTLRNHRDTTSIDTKSVN